MFRNTFATDTPMKQRLMKPKLNDNTTNTYPTTSTNPTPDVYDHELPLRTSFTDLKRPEHKQQIRQHLTNTFPETARSRRSSQDTARRPSQDSLQGVNIMGIKDRLSRTGSTLGVGQNPSAKSSTSSINSMGAAPNRLSTVQEQKAIDVAAAISILEQLKKTASPEELVALHKALLPTKDVETVPSPLSTKAIERPPMSPNPMVRHRSMLPAGLATRGGIDEDILRKPGDVPPRTKRLAQVIKSAPEWGHRKPEPDSVNSLVALDLADDGNNFIGPRAATPSDLEYSQTGAFRSGTLRITNGAASPSPSVLSVSKMIVEQKPSSETLQDGGYFTASEGRPSLDFHAGHNASVESLPIRDRIMNSAKGQQQLRERASRRMSASSETSQTSQVPAPLQLDTGSRRGSIEPVNVSPVVSPMPAEMPRFMQRLSHRVSALSQEYISDCEVPTSPYEDKRALMNFAARLSTVYDSDDEEIRPGKAAREAAFAKLVGKPDKAAQDPVIQPPERNSNRSRPSLETAKNSHSSQSEHVDSGYGSDSAFRTPMSQRKASSETMKPQRTASVAQQPLNEVDEKDEVGASAEEQSLYTFEEVLSSPSLLSERAAPSPSPATPISKKSTSLFRLRSKSSVKRNSLPILGGTPQHSSDSVPTVSSTQSSPAESESAKKAKKAEQIAKQAKKLQKPVPEHIRMQRKKEKLEKLEKLKMQQAGDPEPGSLPEVPVGVASQHLQRLDVSPEIGALACTYTSVNTTDSQEDLVRSPIREASAEIKFPSPSTTPERKRSSSKKRSFSRGRKTSGGKPDKSIDDSPERSASIFRKRSKSRSRSHSRRRLSVDSIGTHERQNSDESIPLYSDFASVSRSLGSNPYDQSTNQFKRSAPVASAVQGLQSPYQISTGLIKSKSMVGMTEEAAAAMARSKSRDVARADMIPAYDRPRMAIPKQQKQKRSQSDSKSDRSVEDYYPDWQSKPAEAATPRPQTNRAFSMYAESIPPMPELPGDFDIKAAKAEEMVAKKLVRDSARSTPSASARNSADNGEQSKQDAVKKAVQARREQEDRLAETESEQLLHPTARGETKRPRPVNIQVSFSYAVSSTNIMLGCVSDQVAVYQYC